MQDRLANMEPFQTRGYPMADVEGTPAQDDPQMWAWMQSHRDEMALMHQHWGDTAWMHTHLTDWSWMQGHWDDMR
jgi:hypothetical protein